MKLPNRRSTHQHTAACGQQPRRTSPVVASLRALVAAGLVAVVLPTTAPVAHGEEGDGDQTEEQAEPAAPGYGGFSSASWATPVRVEVYEPSIPIPMFSRAIPEYSDISV